MILKKGDNFKNNFFAYNNIIKRSVDPQQYDYADINWNPYEKNLFSPVRRLMFNNIEKYIQETNNLNVLDVGCGTGWLLEEIDKYKPNYLKGIDSSEANVEIAKRKMPKFHFECVDFGRYKVKSRFDHIYSIMTLSHFENLFEFFKKCSGMMNIGKIIIIVPDYNYFKRPKKDQKIDLFFFEDDCYAINIEKKGKKISQVVRKNIIYHDLANKNGFYLLEELGIRPDDKFLLESSKDVEKEEVMFNLLVYKKNGR
ncbi:MAG: class I SAM-dependent methyltransferase [Patescibacteria group bacterium]